MKKLVLLICSLVLIFTIFLIMYFRPHSYSDEYKINDCLVKESYDKKNKYYSFVFNYKDKDYNVISLDKYTTKRHLVDEVKIRENDEEVCLNIETHNVTLHSVCSNNNGYFIKEKIEEFKENSSYKNIKISNLNDKTYLLWNYRNFIYLNNKKQEEISLFNKDIYNLNLVYQMDNYLLIPDYKENYKFDKIYYINSNNGKVKDIDLRYEVYFDSYFLGHDKSKVYLYDIKEEQEYYIDIKKDKIYKSKYQLLINNKWEKTTNQKLKNDKLKFYNDKLVEYILKDNKLYLKMIDSDVDYLITNKEVTKIVKQDNFDVYYISKDTLYYYNPIDGSIPLLKYSEWEFNNNNMIFIF